VHAVKDDLTAGEHLTSRYRLPPHIAARAGAVRNAVEFIKTFGLDVVSFPIWDVEGIGCIDDPSIAVMMSLHTSYSLAKPHKREWNTRPLFAHFGVEPVITLEKQLLRTIPTILANSKAIVSDLQRIGDIEFESRTTVAPHGTTDPFTDKPHRRAFRRSKLGPVQLYYVGRFEARKGFDLAAQAFCEILRAFRDVEVHLVGDDITLEKKAWLSSVGAGSLLDDDRLHVHGMVSRERLDDLYAGADAVVMPSRYESFGLVAIEAMAAGAPVIALKSGGLSEVVADGISGYLVDIDGEEVNSIVKVLKPIIRDSELRAQLSAGARKAFEERFTIERMIGGVEMALDHAVQNKGASIGARS
jgi:glycosyltransferase involved in cell wall biosynthesis